MAANVLIIESEPWLGDHYQQTMERHGYTVMRATDGHSAIDMIDDNPPQAIIMSVLLHGPSAFALLHELQSYIDTAGIPVIMCSSLSGLVLDDLRPYGVQRLLDSSSMQPQDLVAAVRSVNIKIDEDDSE